MAKSRAPDGPIHYAGKMVIPYDHEYKKTPYAAKRVGRMPDTTPVKQHSDIPAVQNALDTIRKTFTPEKVKKMLHRREINEISADLARRYIEKAQATAHVGIQGWLPDSPKKPFKKFHRLQGVWRASQRGGWPKQTDATDPYTDWRTGNTLKEPTGGEDAPVVKKKATRKKAVKATTTEPTAEPVKRKRAPTKRKPPFKKLKMKIAPPNTPEKPHVTELDKVGRRKRIKQALKVDESVEKKRTKEEIIADVKKALKKKKLKDQIVKKIKEKQKNLKEDASSFSGVGGVAGMGFGGGADLAGVDDAVGDYRGTNMMAYEDNNGNLLEFIRKSHYNYHNSKLGYKAFNPRKIGASKNFHKKKKELNEIGDFVKDGMPGYEGTSALPPRTLRLSNPMAKKIIKEETNLQEISKELASRYFQKVMSKPFSTEMGGTIKHNPTSQKSVEINRMKGIMRAKARGAEMGPRWKLPGDNAPVNSIDKIMRKKVYRYGEEPPKKPTKREVTGMGRERLVKAMNVLKGHDWALSYPSRLATPQQREPDLFWQGPKQPPEIENEVPKAMAHRSRVRDKLERVVARLNQYGDKETPSKIKANSMSGMEKQQAKTFSPVQRVGKDKTPPLKNLWNPGKKVNTGYSYEETTMDTKEMIREAIISIIREDYVNMQSLFTSVIQEKASDRLDELKKEIAATYFVKDEE